MTATINFLDYFGSTLSLIGTLLLIHSYTKFHEIEHTISKGIEREGIVVELRDDPNKVDDPSKYKGKAPVVDWQTVNGSYRHHSTTYKNPTPYEVGQKVKIYHYRYHSRDERALADDEPGTLPKTLMKWGMIFCVIGYPILLSKMGRLF